jgi:hypothetical protein
LFTKLKLRFELDSEEENYQHEQAAAVSNGIGETTQTERFWTNKKGLFQDTNYY